MAEARTFRPSTWMRSQAASTTYVFRLILTIFGKSFLSTSTNLPASRNLLSSLQREFLGIFAGLPDQDKFYLTGGTALAEFYLGHRLSYDLDFFTAQTDLILPFSRQLESACAQQDIGLTVIRRFATFVQLTFSREDASHKVDLALDSPFRLEPPLLCKYGVYINNYTDLIIDKVLAYFGRSEPRDAIDLYFIIQREPLDRLLSLAAQKDTGFDLYWFAVALNRVSSFPDEIERWPVKMLVEINPADIKKRFQSLAIELMNRISS